MPNELTTPLRALLAQASKKLPAATGETAAFRKRYENASDKTVILCDVSSSMDESAGARKKIDHLREALQNLTREGLSGFHVLWFNSTAGDVPVNDAAGLPAPSGGTAMHLGLDAAAKFHPRATVVISDGMPDSRSEALSAAARLTGVIDVIYCGPDSETAAIEFMRQLARAGGGRVVVQDLRRATGPALGATVRQLLALPAPKGQP